ncbi:MAG TPA: phosphoribosylanthranilate isomerase [Allocoleopsis sp.]
MRVKICGITKPDQGRAIAELGATALGFICVEVSPRYVTAEQIRRVVEQLPRHSDTGSCVDRIGVFANATVEEISQVVAIAGLTGVQLHGAESPEFCAQVRDALPEVEVIKALRIKSTEALQAAAAYYGQVHTLLLDAYHPGALGGTGITLDWQSLQQFAPTYPWFLAGGLTPNNINQALAQLQPDGIDLSSGVERSPGDKDLAQVAHLFQQLQTAQKIGAR